MDDTAATPPSCQQVIDVLPDPFVVIDRDYRIISANIGYKRRYSTNGEDPVGRHCFEVSHHNQAPCHHYGEHCPLEAVFRDGEPQHVMHVHYDGEDRPEYVQIQATPLRDSSGEVTYMGEFIHPVAATEQDEMLIGRSRPLLRMASLLQRVAPTSTTVLLLGESGAGKESAAHYLHHYSKRSEGPFVIVDCGVLGESLIENELFGSEKGAFTGSVGRKKGLFEAAGGGTLLIDEICELPLPLQTKLLRVLETGTIRRIGGTEYVPVDARVVAATNRDIKQMVARGEFRQDLYYRLSAFPVEIPPLRERRSDIPRIAEYFLARSDGGDRHLPLPADVIQALLEYDYPGNVRELRNVVERAVILAGDGMMKRAHLVYQRERAASSEPPAEGGAVAESRDPLTSRRRRVSDEALLAALDECDGHRAQAARRLGISERTVYRRVDRLRAAQG